MPEYYEPPVDSALQSEENKLVNTALSKLPQPYISGLKLNADISLYKTSTETALTLNTIDSNGVVWVVTDIDGWWTLPEPELPDLPRGWGDGSYDAVGRWTSRILTLNGSFLPQRPEDAAIARNTLFNFTSNLVKESGSGYLIVNEPDIANPGQVVRKSAQVRLSGVPQITSVNARGRHDFSIGLKAVDPIKYEFVAGHPEGYDDVVISSNGSTVSTTITNKGNTAVPVIFEISSAFNAPSDPNYARITNATSDQTITIVGGTSTNVKLEIDTYSREVVAVDYSTVTPEFPEPGVENARSKVAVIADWIYLQPGANQIVLTNFPSGSSCTVYFKSGWIG